MSSPEDQLEATIGPFYDADGACTVLRVDQERLGALVASRQVLALTTGDGTVVYPVAQFRADGSTTPHLAEVLNELARGSDEPWTWALWCMAPDDDLDGLTTIEWLADDRDPEPVLREAAADATRWAT